MAEGRRERMRNKVRTHGIEGLPPHEIVEFLLYPFVPRKDTSPLAKALLNELGGLDNLLKATEEELLSFPGMPKMAALTFPLYKPLVESANTLNTRNRNKCTKDSSQASKYCINLLKNCYNERVIAIYLDTNEKILGQKIISEGTINRAKIDFTNISKGAILYNAKRVIIAHNHPNGGMFPSTDDLLVTNSLKEYLEKLDIKLLDHFIICGDEAISIVRGRKQ